MKKLGKSVLAVASGVLGTFTCWRSFMTGNYVAFAIVLLLSLYVLYEGVKKVNSFGKAVFEIVSLLREQIELIVQAQAQSMSEIETIKKTIESKDS